MTGQQGVGVLLAWLVHLGFCLHLGLMSQFKVGLIQDTRYHILGHVDMSYVCMYILRPAFLEWFD